MTSIDKPQCKCPKRAELPDVNINTGAQSINTERACLKLQTFSEVYCKGITAFQMVDTLTVVP